MKILNLLLLDKEARLFDTKEFLIKTFVAVLIGAFVGRLIPYVAKDMISVLFGMMLTIEPVNRAGIRSGLKQVEATIIGALITGIILAMFGLNPWTTALGVTTTLYVSLLIDWKNYSVVAVFTSIYMTQYPQFDAFGNRSELLTFRLRITALITGVLIAFFVNWIFSVFGYKHMLEKRMYHIMNDLSDRMKSIQKMMENGSFEEAQDIMRSFPGVFHNIDWIYGTCVDYEKDPLAKRGQPTLLRLEKIMKMTGLIREIAHVSYDICYRISKGDHHYKEEEFVEPFNRSLNKVILLEEKLDLIIHNKDVTGEIALTELESDEAALRQIDENIGHIDALLNHY